MILIIEDNKESLESYIMIIEEILDELGLLSSVPIESATTYEEADKKLSELDKDTNGLVLMDMALPRGGWEDVLAGYKLIQKFQKGFNSIRWIAMTSRIDMRGTILESGMSVFEELYRLSLFGLWKKDEPAKLVTLIKRYFTPIPKPEEPFFKEELSGGKVFVTQNENLVSEILNVAMIDRGVLLFGERGTGKSLIAELIHLRSTRNNDRFEIVDGSAEDIEKIIMGKEDEKPFWQRSDSILSDLEGGTLYIKNLNNVPPLVQRKLWTYVMNIKKVNCRLIGGIEINRKDFRDNNSINRDFLDECYAFDVPSLQDRSEDLQVLIQLFVEQFNKETGQSKEFAEMGKICTLLSTVKFPNNISGLRRFIFDVLLKSSISVVTLEEVKAYLKKSQLGFFQEPTDVEPVHQSVSPTEGETTNIPTIYVTEEDVDKLRRRLRK